MEFCGLGRDKIRQTGQEFLQKCRESWRLRAAVFFALAVCAAAALFVCQDMPEGREDIEEHLAVSGGSIGREGVSQGRPPAVIRGGGEAAAGENLRNPFLPGHPDEKQQKPAERGRLRAEGAERQGGRAKPAANSAGSGSGTAALGGAFNASAASAAPAHGQAGKKAELSVQLQGIIRDGGGAGALLLVGGDTRLLLAGEEAEGCLLESVGQEEAVIAAGGRSYRLQIGDKAPLLPGAEAA